MFWRGEHTFAELHALGGTAGLYPPVKKTYFVDKLGGGSDSQTGLGSWRNAKATYQAGVTAATCADNRYKDVDLIIAPAEYDEQVVVSGVAQGQYSGSTWYGWRMGRLRIIAMGEKVILKNSGASLDSNDTLRICRMKVELHGGTFRNYTNTAGSAPGVVGTARTGAFAGVRWERTPYSDTVGDVIGGAMYGCRVEGRDSALIGIDIDQASYVEIVGCKITGWVHGIHIAQGPFGYPTDNVVKDCYFKSNSSADIALGGGYNTLIDNCLFADDGISTYIVSGATAAYAGRGGTPSDAFVTHCSFNAASINSQLHTGIKYVGSMCQDY